MTDAHQPYLESHRGAAVAIAVALLLVLGSVLGVGVGVVGAHVASIALAHAAQP